MILSVLSTKVHKSQVVTLAAHIGPTNSEASAVEAEGGRGAGLGRRRRRCGKFEDMTQHSVLHPYTTGKLHDNSPLFEARTCPVEAR